LSCPALPCRYLLKLFRDLLFHQVDEEGAPLLDWGLAAEALNKVDAGVPEKVGGQRRGQ
jgi:PAB-dependent poly(A)-specific ribonuclease subunit 3